MSDPTGMNHWIDPNGIVHVAFDRPDDKVNLLTPDLLRDLGELLDSVRGHDEVRGIIFKSAKAGNFIAGNTTSSALSPSVSFVSVSLSLATAPRSPALSSGIVVWAFPCMASRCPNRSAVSRVLL